MNLRIITPQEVAYEAEVSSVTAPGSEGELTVLPHHVPLFTSLAEGVVEVKGVSTEKDGDMFFSIGGGYLETDGQNVNLLVSRAYGQDAIDEAEVEKARARAEKLIENAATEEERHEAMMSLRRSMVDLKVLSKVRRKAPRRGN